MSCGFARLPEAPAFRLINAHVPAAVLDAPVVAANGEGIARVDIAVEEGVVASVTPAGVASSGLPAFDMDGGLVFPGFVDAHTHLDKGHIWPRRPNPDGTFMGALEAVRTDREAFWSGEDVGRRMDFALRSAHAHGSVAVRTHIDSLPPQHRISWPVFAAMREAWAGRIELQGVSLIPIDLALDDAFHPDLVDVVLDHGGMLGAVTFVGDALRPGLARMFRLAAERGLDLDFHVDETADPAAHSLRVIAEMAIEHGFEGKILVGHCCSLARQGEAEADKTMDLIAEAGIAVVSLPMCNMYLQDRRAGRTPRWRGVTLLHELAARGVPVIVASDNTRDPFYAYGDLDMLETYREATRILQLDHPVADWPKAIGATPAAILRLKGRGVIRAGAAADLVLTRARRWTELNARPQADRTVLRAGKAIDTTPPDYRELDDLAGFAA